MPTKIQYAIESWNPIVGCQHASEGCDHCYAEKMAARIASMSPLVSKYSNVIDERGWNGNAHLSYKDLDKPFHWKTPRRIFVCSMSDLFYKGPGDYGVLDPWIDKVIAVIALNPQHTFLILTKRALRMKMCFFRTKPELIRDLTADHIFTSSEKLGNGDNRRKIEDAVNNWPLKNLWLGVTAENQRLADHRIPDLLNTPAAKRFVSYEPALAPLDLTEIDRLTGTGIKRINALAGVEYYPDLDTNRYDTPCNKLDWVICGAESGPGHRPMNEYDAYRIASQCEYHKVPFFFKQKYIGNKKISMPVLNGKIYDQIPQ